ncbi:hypothetical protein ES703_88936 [subsurface metagenome]
MNNERVWWGTKVTVLAAVATTALATYATFESKKTVEKAMEALHQQPLYKTAGSLVSIIIPTLNEENYLPLLLSSIQNQTYEPIEVIVADSSTDSTPQIAQDASATVVSVEELNVSLARNEGARAAQGDILIFCDADCILANDFVERLVASLGDGVVLSHGSHCVYDDGFNNFLSAYWKYLKPNMWTTGRGVAISRDNFFAVGGYDVGCDPTEGCREDLALGVAVESFFGPGSVHIDRNAIVATSARRPIGLRGGMWQERGYRNGVIPV